MSDYDENDIDDMDVEDISDMSFEEFRRTFSEGWMKFSKPGINLIIGIFVKEPEEKIHFNILLQQVSLSRNELEEAVQFLEDEEILVSNDENYYMLHPKSEVSNLLLKLDEML